MANLKLEIPFGQTPITLETGSLARLASGAVTARWGDTVILATAVVGDQPREGVDYLPLMVDYEERLYAAGKISGSRFIKREGRPSDRAILSARLIDRPLRPLFPKHFRHDIHVVITVLSYDGEHSPDVLAITAASASLIASTAPFNGPVAASRVVLVDGVLVVNPTEDQRERSELDIVVASTGDKVIMLEAAAKQASEEIVFEAIKQAVTHVKPSIELQQKLANSDPVSLVQEDTTITGELAGYAQKKLEELLAITEQAERENQLKAFEAQVLANFEGNYAQIDLKTALGQLVDKLVRSQILDSGKRPDGRGLDEIRPLKINVATLPRTHGTGLFERGDTQVLTIATLGAPGDEQLIDTMEEEGSKRYMHHYNFPPFSVGEVRPIRGPSRRDIGHGSLAERALLPVLPDKEKFPYTIRLVSEVLTSNGSTSMAATCGSTLALMDAGVPISAPVAGISIGLISRGDKDLTESAQEGVGQDYVLLTDIQGVEDFAGDMDFKVAGSVKGVTAIQMDTKIQGLTLGMIETVLERAKKSRIKILQAMAKVLPEPRAELSSYAPRIYTIKVDPAKIGDVIGPRGKIVNQIIEDAGGKELISIDIEDDGTIHISSPDKSSADKAIEAIKNITLEPEIGAIYAGPVTEIIKNGLGKEIGAIVKFLPNRDGMVHISEVAPERIVDVSSRLKVGDEVKVKVVGIDAERGRVSLSIRQTDPNYKPVDRFPRRSGFNQGPRPAGLSQPKSQPGRLWAKKS